MRFVVGGAANPTAMEINVTDGTEGESEFMQAPFPRPTRKVDIKLPGKGNSNSHGARPVY